MNKIVTNEPYKVYANRVIFDINYPNFLVHIYPGKPVWRPGNPVQSAPDLTENLILPSTEMLIKSYSWPLEVNNTKITEIADINEKQINYLRSVT